MSAKRLRQKIANYIVKRLRELAPKDTGNLAFQSITKVTVSDTTIEIYVNQDIAPYMPYTNEPWISPKWNGKPNPNESWWNNAMELILQEVAQVFGGVLTNDAKA